MSTPTGTRHTAAGQFYRAVRRFAATEPDWGECLILQTTDAEARNLPLISMRAYGTRDETLAIMAAAGLDSVEQPLSPRRLKLPNAQRLAALKSAAGLITEAWRRQAGEEDNPLSQP